VFKLHYAVLSVLICTGKHEHDAASNEPPVSVQPLRVHTLDEQIVPIVALVNGQVVPH